MPGRYNWPDGHEPAEWIYRFYDEVRDYCVQEFNDGESRSSSYIIRVPIRCEGNPDSSSRDPWHVVPNGVMTSGELGWSIEFQQHGPRRWDAPYTRWRDNHRLPPWSVYLTDTTSRFDVCPPFRRGTIRTLDSNNRWRYIPAPHILTRLGQSDADA